MSYPIEKGFALPQVHSRYNWKKMEVGDSFFVPKAERRTNVVRAAACWANKQYAPKHWIVRARVENDVPGVRVWRRD